MKHHALLQLQSNNSTQKVGASIGMNQSWIAQLKKALIGEVKKQDEGIQDILVHERKDLV